MCDVYQAQLPELLDNETLTLWHTLAAAIDELYDVDRLWGKGFGQWKVEYKYRRGGKTLCTFYAGQGSAVLIVVLGKAEREKFEAQRGAFTEGMKRLYDSTQSLHDGKCLCIPIDKALSLEDVRLLLQIKRRPNRKQA